MEFEKKIIKVDDLCERFDEKCSRRAVLNDLAKKSKKTTGWFYKYIYNIEIISIAVISIILFILLSCLNDSGLYVGKILNRLCFAEKNVYIFYMIFLLFYTVIVLVVMSVGEYFLGEKILKEYSNLDKDNYEKKYIFLRKTSEMIRDILEDDKNISEIEQFALKNAGYEVSAFATASDFENALTKEHPDLIIMDIMLPDRDGLSVLKDVRAEQSTAKLPVIMVTAKTSEMDKVKGLDQGADDYMTKPFGIMELISRVKALLRRANVSGGSHIYSFDGITMDDAKHQVLVDGQETELTYKEYQLLKMLIQNSGIVLQRSQILDRVWGIDYEGESRTLDMHIKTLRRKIGEKGNLIQTVRNVGYTMNYRKDK